MRTKRRQRKFKKNTRRKKRGGWIKGSLDDTSFFRHFKSRCSGTGLNEDTAERFYKVCCNKVFYSDPNNKRQQNCNLALNFVAKKERVQYDINKIEQEIEQEIEKNTRLNQREAAGLITYTPNETDKLLENIVHKSRNKKNLVTTYNDMFLFAKNVFYIYNNHKNLDEIKTLINLNNHHLYNYLMSHGFSYNNIMKQIEIETAVLYHITDTIEDDLKKKRRSKFLEHKKSQPSKTIKKPISKNDYSSATTSMPGTSSLSTSSPFITETEDAAATEASTI
jgi:hypothetical protein